jgi:hypothetical protein
MLLIKNRSIVHYISAPAFAQKLWRAGQHDCFGQYVGHKTLIGVMEYWRTGVLFFNITPRLHHANTPSFLPGVCSLLFSGHSTLNSQPSTGKDWLPGLEWASQALQVGFPKRNCSLSRTAMHQHPRLQRALSYG